MEEELRTIVEMSHDGIVILDEDHSVRFANTNASELTCYGIDELMGMDFLVLFSKKNRKAVTNMLEMKHSGQENVRFCSEFEILTSQGAKKETEICITNTINEKGDRKSYVYIRDI